ncbi:hypothetical protein [Pedobacter nyackensis]|uniref:Lipoprotein n=1 Tax=Pedobacter nyackensis TaxID=475255 RepID=A0A1W2AIL3_9SPHI|nr:hypothetical protein [Pedobacter nyackensis]SMC60464.1 hypothetical protein SAMN04488101_101646 [Pedobacter nyackensis]
MKNILPFILLVLLIAGCKKKTTEENQDQQYFEVLCNDCTVNYSNDNGSISTANNIKGSFKKEYLSSRDIEISVQVITTATIKIYHGNFNFSREYDKNVYLTYSKSSRYVNDGSSSGSGSGNYGCGSYNGKTLYLGSQGGCYYLTSGGNKSYVDRNYCKCN